MKAGKVQPGQDSRKTSLDITEQGGRDGTAGTGQPVKDIRDTTAETRLP
jgi:hypothetical protein